MSASIHRLPVLLPTSARYTATIISIATELNVFADGPEYKTSNLNGSVNEQNTINGH
jgi:hypothetical protein